MDLLYFTLKVECIKNAVDFIYFKLILYGVKGSVENNPMCKCYKPVNNIIHVAKCNCQIVYLLKCIKEKSHGEKHFIGLPHYKQI